MGLPAAEESPELVKGRRITWFGGPPVPMVMLLMLAVRSPSTQHPVDPNCGHVRVVRLRVLDRTLQLSVGGTAADDQEVGLPGANVLDGEQRPVVVRFTLANILVRLAGLHSRQRP